MSRCNEFNPENVYKRFKLMEFPISFVGLSTTQDLNVEVNLDIDAYIKTTHNGKLLEFEKAREVSASHRAFMIARVDQKTLKITFKPSNECIAKVRQENKSDENICLIDLRLIKVRGKRCCNEETHSEMGRFYISGHYEFCNISHHPKAIDFEEVALRDKSVKTVRIRNDSQKVAAKFKYIKVTNYDVVPKRFTILPNSTKKIQVNFKPSGDGFPKQIPFAIRNAYDHCDNHDLDHCADNNFVYYTIKSQAKLVYETKRKIHIEKSLLKLAEKNPIYTYMGDELILYNERKNIAQNLYAASKKLHHGSTLPKVKFVSKKDKCESKISLMQPVTLKKKINTYSLLNITLTPFKVNFGRIGVNTYGEQEICIRNDSEYDIDISMLRHDIISYTKERYSQYKVKIKSLSKVVFSIICFGSINAHTTGSFNYLIDDKFYKSHDYNIEVGNSMLMTEEPSLTFGMVTSECFITSAAIKLYNHFNIDINFEWKETDTPFEVKPTNGIVLKRSAKICDITYLCKSTKAKSYEIELISKGQITKVIPIELTIMTRKCSIKFLQAAVNFEDIALNIETAETVKLENSSRELASYVVLDPSIPGITIEPMSGAFQPKSVNNIIIKATIACLIEFEFELLVKINNKEVISIPVSGNVIEPKLVVHPKTVYMPRVPIDMVTYVQVIFQNTGTLRCVVDVVDKEENTQMCEAVFQVFIANGPEKLRVESFFVDPDQSKCIYIKVHDVFLREYDMYIPFRINRLLGPPLRNNSNSCSIELSYYTKQYQEMYENHPKVHVKSISRDIAYFRIGGVITVRWIELSVKHFEINYAPGGDNKINFTMTNVSKYYLYVAIMTGKLSPNFEVEVTATTADIAPTVTESQIKLELDIMNKVEFCLKFHPISHGRHVAVAIIFLDRTMSIPYSNLTFIGTWQKPKMTASIHQIIFPHCFLRTEQSRYFTITLALATDLALFTCIKEEQCVTVSFENSKILQDGNERLTVVDVKVKVFCEYVYAQKITLYFHHECGSECEVDVYFCFTCCPLMMHSRSCVALENDPYPFYPLSTQTEYYEYMEKCKSFLERWLYQQGFHRDLYPEIPDTFLVMSPALSSSFTAKAKGVNVSFLNYIKRVAGPLIKHIHKITFSELKEPFRTVKEIHDTYQQIINLLKSRGGNTLVLKAKFLLSYDQFLIYMDNVPSRSNSEMIMSQELQLNADLFHRLSKQSWFDLILQTYKVFVMDSCFFDCMCITSKPRDIVQILIGWYNEHINLQQIVCCVKLRRKVVSNLTSDLSDGIAIMSVLLVCCPFLIDKFSLFADTNDKDPKGAIINYACLIIEAMNEIKLFFPLSVQDLLQPNFLHMLFLSIHLFVVLPTLKSKENVEFSPPLLKSSTRQVVINPTTQETLMYTFTILYNNSGCFTVEKVQIPDSSGKKFYLNVTFRAKFIKTETAYLLVQGYNKTRIFDTYLMFHLIGKTGSLNPLQKCKVTGSLYRPSKVDISVSSPFMTLANFEMFITDVEPNLPVDFEEFKTEKSTFCVHRLNLIDKEIILIPPTTTRDTATTENPEVKIYLQIICLSTLPANYWIWFRSEIGEFFIRVLANCRSDMPVDTFQVPLKSWPTEPCSCGDSCECYRSMIVMIPHRNDLMLKALRCALLEHANQTIMEIYDQLVVSVTGQMILLKLFAEGGTNIADIEHILRPVSKHRITSKNILPRLDHVTLNQHTDAVLALPVTVPPNDKADKYIITFSSESGVDIRNYRIMFVEQVYSDE